MAWHDNVFAVFPASSAECRLAWIFAQTGSTTLVWLAFPAMEIIRFAIAAVMVRWTYQGKIVKLQTAQAG